MSPLLLSLVLSSTLPGPKMIDFYIGTYTSEPGSKGIYHAQLNPKTGEIGKPALAVEAENPSYVAIAPHGKFLYAVHESTEGEVSAYAIQPDHKLARLNTQMAKGGGPCHVSVDPTGRFVFTAAYGGGTVASFPILADGSLAPAASLFENHGSGPDRNRQDRPHMHAAYADAASRYVYACDLGTDDILAFRLDPASGALTAGNPATTKAPAGGGPRHLTFRPDGRVAYVNLEMANAVTAWSVDPESGALKQIQTLSTLKDGGNRAGKTTAEIVCHPSGRWLYVSNRGDDSLAVFRIAADGTLELVEVFALDVKEPRGFDIDPSGRWLVVAGQNSNDLTTLAIDPHSGRLSSTGYHVAVDKPVCVAFPKP